MPIARQQASMPLEWEITKTERMKFSVCFDIVLWQLGIFILHVWRIFSGSLFAIPSWIISCYQMEYIICVYVRLVKFFLSYVFTTKIRMNSTNRWKKLSLNWSPSLQIESVLRVVVDCDSKTMLKMYQTHFIHFKHTTYPNMQTHILFVNKFNICCFLMNLACYMSLSAPASTQRHPERFKWFLVNASFKYKTKLNFSERCLCAFVMIFGLRLVIQLSATKTCLLPQIRYDALRFHSI